MSYGYLTYDMTYFVLGVTILVDGVEAELKENCAVLKILFFERV